MIHWLETHSIINQKHCTQNPAWNVFYNDESASFVRGYRIRHDTGSSFCIKQKKKTTNKTTRRNTPDILESLLSNSDVETRVYPMSYRDPDCTPGSILHGVLPAQTSSSSSSSSNSSSSSSSSWILMSCQPHRVTSGQSNSGHKQIHISKLFSHIYQPSVKSVYKINHFANIKHTYTNIRHTFSKS